MMQMRTPQPGLLSSSREAPGWGSGFAQAASELLRDTQAYERARSQLAADLALYDRAVKRAAAELAATTTVWRV